MFVVSVTHTKFIKKQMLTIEHPVITAAVALLEGEGLEVERA